MPRAGLLATALAALVGCELVTGITDKTLVAADASSGGVPCSKQPANLFCDDFDSEQTFPPVPPWDWDIGTPTSGGGIATLDTSAYATSPHSARFVAPAVANVSAQLGKDIGKSVTSTYHLAFDLRLDTSDPGHLPETSIAQVLAQGVGLSVNYVVGPGQACSLQVFDTNAGSAPVASAMLQCPPLQKWTTIVVTGDAQGNVSVAEDGQPLGSTKARAGAPGDIKFIVGVVYENLGANDSTVTLELDDVVLSGS